MERSDDRSPLPRLDRALDLLPDPHQLIEPVLDASGAIVDFRITFANQALLTQHLQDVGPVVGATILELFPTDQGREVVAMYRHCFETGEAFEITDFVPANGDDGDIDRHFEVFGVRVDDHLLVTWRDVSDRIAHTRRLADMATHDSLTGLANRAALLDELRRALSSSRRSGRRTGVLIIDLDHFKQINDSFGHATGDELLRVAASRIQRCVRSEDLVARVGGDEFVIVLRDLDDPAEAMRTANRVVEAFRSPLMVEGHELPVTASIGVVLDSPEDTADELQRHADTALYLAKDEGRDRAALFNQDVRAAVTLRLDLESQLRPALAQRELEVWFQPEIDLDGGAIVGVEALLRWRRDDGEVVAADRFIEVAEETGLIVPIGEWVISVAAQHAARWAQRHPHRRLVVRVNVATSQLAEASFAAMVRSALDDSGLDPSLLALEVDEDSLHRGSSAVRWHVAELRSMGVGITLDDFGAGLASLSALRDWPVDTIKVDGVVVRRVVTDEADRRLVSGVVALAHSLGLGVIAEGVEDTAQADMLWRLGCHRAQGYLYAPAMPADEIDRLLAN